MNVQFDPGDDFQVVVDGLEEITLAPLAGGASVVLSALRRPPTRQEVNLLNDSVGLKLEDIVWHFADAALDGLTPSLGDTITDSESHAWTIVGTSRQVLRNHWRVICQKQA